MVISPLAGVPPVGFGEFSLPCDATSFESVVVFGENIEVQGFLSEHDMLAVDPLNISRRSLVLGGFDAEFERGIRFQAIDVCPLDGDDQRAISNRDRWSGDLSSIDVKGQALWEESSELLYQQVFPNLLL